MVISNKDMYSEVCAGRKSSDKNCFGGVNSAVSLHWILVTASWMEVAT